MKHGPHWKHLRDTLVIVPNFQDDHPENKLKTEILGTKSAIKQARQLKTTRKLFHVMRILFAVILVYLNAGLGPQCP